MNIQKILYSAILAAASACLAVAAVADEESFIVSGVGFDYRHWPEGQETSYLAVIFEAEITYDPDSPLRPFSSGQANFHWWDQSLSFDLKVYDFGGALLDHQIIEPIFVPATNYFPAAYMFADAAGKIEKFGFRIPEVEGTTNFSASIVWFPPSGALHFEPVYPDWEWGTLVGTGNTFAMSRVSETPAEGDFRFTGFVDSFGSGDDTDGDGVPQGQDSCPESDTSATVEIGGIDSGVENTLDDDGCTLADRLALAIADARNHGQKVSAASHFLNGLVNDGLISGRERGALLNAIARTK